MIAAVKRRSTKMKKLLSVFIMFLFSVSAYSMANIELDLGFPIGIQNRQNVKYKWSNVKGEHMDLGLPDGYSENSGGSGMEFRGNFFFVSPNKYIDFGFEAGLGWLLWEETELSDGLPGSECTNDGWSNFYILCGPALRVNFNRFASVAFSAGFKPLMGFIDFDGYGNYEDGFMAGVDAYFSASGKFWVVSKRRFHFGFNTGINIFVPINGYYSFDPEYEHTGYWQCKYDRSDSFGANFYIGVCFNFGAMSLDRF